MKKIQSLSFVATLAVGMISWGSVLHAQTTPSTPPDQQTPQTQPTPSPEMPPSAQQTPSATTPDAQQPATQPSPKSTNPDATAPEAGAQPSSPAGSSATSGDSQTFAGTVVKQGDKYVLKDDAGKTYDIDHQSDVAKFEGKRVRVQGTLDANGKIMVK